MKKFFTTLALALLTLAASAQENPNRVIVKQKYKAPVGYLAERIDSIYFTKLEGRVAADVKFLSFSKGNLTDTIRLAVTKTPECKSYKIACMPAGQANSFASDAALEQYFDQLEDCPTFTDDFTNATLTGLDMEFQSNGTYSLVTLGYDKYGIACASSRADFTTPNSDLVGDPKVLYTVVEVKPDNFTIWFQPNDDCYGYYLCAFKAGTAEELFEKWSKEEGFVNLQDMIKSWGSDKYTDTQMYKWSGMEPGTDYEVYVLPVDVNEADAPFQIIPITTTESGGEGEATVTIKLGDFGEVGGNYFQYVWFTPNDEATLMRDLVLAKNDVMTQDYWGKGDLEFIKEYLTNDDMPDYWNRYGEDYSQWGVYANTDYYAFAIAQNAKGEWGPLATLEFRTPASAPGAAPAKPGRPCVRLDKVVNMHSYFEPGKAPNVMPKSRKTRVSLVEE